MKLRGLVHVPAEILGDPALWPFDRDQDLIARPEGDREPFPLWHEFSDGSLLVPRFWLENFTRALPARAPIQEHPQRQFKGELRDNQKTPVSEILHELPRKEGLLLRADCGTGKTVMGLYCADALQAARVGVLVDQVDIAEQWKGAIERFLPEATVEILGGGHGQMRRDTRARFTIMVGQSLWRQEWAEDPMELDMLLVDEAHVFSAPCFFGSLTNLAFTWSIALTATPDRRDGLEWVFKAALGNHVVEAAAKLVPATIYRYPVTTLVEYDDYRMAWCKAKVGMTTLAGCRECPDFAGFPTSCPGRPPLNPMVTPPDVAWKDKHNYTAYIQTVIADPAYSAWLVNIVGHLFQKGRQVMVFGQFQKQLIHLHELWEARHPGSSGLFFGKHAKVGRVGRDASLDKPVTFCTYGIADKALDVPWKDAAVLASPRRDVRQTRGRIEREVDGKPVPIVVDPVHTNSPVLAALGRRRLASYKDARCHVIDYPGL